MATGAPTLRDEGGGVCSLAGLEHLPPGEAAAGAALTALVDEAFQAGHHRVEAQVAVGPAAGPQDVALRRALQRAGLRPEGTARGRALVDGRPQDVLRLARLREDPAPGEPGAFLGMLNATLPRKRVIVQGLLRDAEGRVLLCELTYKRDWDLPGGVAEPAESPVTSLRRELCEELGLELPVGELRAVDWLPPYRQWEDAVLLVFDVPAAPGALDGATLQPSEVAAVHWVDPAGAAAHVAPYVARLLTSLDAAPDDRCLFLEDGLLRAPHTTDAG